MTINSMKLWFTYEVTLAMDEYVTQLYTNPNTTLFSGSVTCVPYVSIEVSSLHTCAECPPGLQTYGRQEQYDADGFLQECVKMFFNTIHETKSVCSMS